MSFGNPDSAVCLKRWRTSTNKSKGRLMKKRLPLLLGLIALASPLAFAQTSTWIPDKAHSEVAFSILHLAISNVHGHFGNISGAVTWNDKDITKSTVNVTIDVSTVDTGVAPRDTDLKSPNFFDVGQYPTATFASAAVAKNRNGLTITGDLTLHGVTKPVVLEVEGPRGPVSGMDKKPHSGFSATTTLSRTAFNIAPKYPAAVVGDEVKLTIDLDVAKQ
jgi:polyisoprenoid-binding protein YceI